MSKTKSLVRGRVDPNIKMTGKTVLITGANAGLGLASSIDIAKRGAKVIMACRNMSKAQDAKQLVSNPIEKEMEILLHRYILEKGA